MCLPNLRRIARNLRPPLLRYLLFLSDPRGAPRAAPRPGPASAAPGAGVPAARQRPRGPPPSALRVGNFTRRKLKLRFCMFCGFLEILEKFVVFRKSPQNLCIVFKQRSESPQICAILRKTCAKNTQKNTQQKPRAKFPRRPGGGSEVKRLGFNPSGFSAQKV